MHQRQIQMHVPFFVVQSDIWLAVSVTPGCTLAVRMAPKWTVNMLNKTCNEKLCAFHRQTWCLGHWVIGENDETAHALELQAFEIGQLCINWQHSCTTP